MVGDRPRSRPRRSPVSCRPATSAPGQPQLVVPGEARCGRHRHPGASAAGLRQRRASIERASPDRVRSERAWRHPSRWPAARPASAAEPRSPRIRARSRPATRAARAVGSPSARRRFADDRQERREPALELVELRGRSTSRRGPRPTRPSAKIARNGPWTARAGARAARRRATATPAPAEPAGQPRPLAGDSVPDLAELPEDVRSRRRRATTSSPRSQSSRHERRYSSPVRASRNATNAAGSFGSRGPRRASGGPAASSRSAP